MFQDRKSDYSIEKLILRRHSSRAFSQEPVTDQELMTLFEAARWAQNSYNNQPWRFVYARCESPAWVNLFALLVAANQEWVKCARVLIVVVSKMTFDKNGKPSRTHSFDTGAACQNMALQGAAMGIIVHGMAGFDYDGARRVLQISTEYSIETMFAIGKQGDINLLPPNLQQREALSERKSFNEFVVECRDSTVFPW